ncbi:MAG: STAS domain-containing protein, partial [Alphaproteobacteria bacterium]|nr:STAS domain-containing protein [Alphaproteobacteria bacterium]
MTEVEPNTNSRSIAIPAILDAGAAVALLETLNEAFGAAEGVSIEAGEVQRVTTPGLQVLAVAARSFAARGLPFSYADPAPPL